MDAALLARIQFAFTVGFHFLFPPLSIGMAWVVMGLLWRHLKTGDETILKAAKFWIRILALTFAVGVATGITMEFQFGTNWSEYSRYVGDIFGAPLAAEGIFAFFLESSFLGVLLFGWNRLSKKTLWFASLMVAVGSTLSAFWIIVANSWMQTLLVAFIASIAQLGMGHWHAVQVYETQPEKFAAVEGHFETRSGVPMLAFGIPDYENRTVHAAIKIPKMLSLLATGNPNAEIRGLNDFPREEWPRWRLPSSPSTSWSHWDCTSSS